ncbi:hypothetical protein [Terrihabitans sp. B22-R8]|uniref:hypothetical protein n=1 Tax=Terrihabitans sp. B22-R8 TaxID=3425128 RepID=UPI00403C1B39
MADQRLAKFTIDPAGEEFRVRIESESGREMEFIATYDQLDILADQIDEVLDAEEDVLEVEGAFQK